MHECLEPFLFQSFQWVDESDLHPPFVLSNYMQEA